MSERVRDLLVFVGLVLLGTVIGKIAENIYSILLWVPMTLVGVACSVVIHGYAFMLLRAFYASPRTALIQTREIARLVLQAVRQGSRVAWVGHIRPFLKRAAILGGVLALGAGVLHADAVAPGLSGYVEPARDASAPVVALVLAGVRLLGQGLSWVLALVGMQLYLVASLVIGPWLIVGLLLGLIWQLVVAWREYVVAAGLLVVMLMAFGLWRPRARLAGHADRQDEEVPPAGGAWRKADADDTWRDVGGDAHHDRSEDAGSAEVPSEGESDASDLDELGLRGRPFTEAEARTAYRRLMQRFAADAGGTSRAQQRINDAWLRVRQRRGWRK